MSDLISRLRTRVNDCPLPTEYMMDEAADMLEALAARVAELEAELASAERQDFFDLQGKLAAAEAREAKLRTETEVKALIAAALQRAANVVPQGWCAPETAKTQMDVTLGLAIQSAILALIDTDHAAALEAVKAKAWNDALERAARIIEAMRDDAPYGSRLSAVLYDAKHAIRARKVQP